VPLEVKARHKLQLTGNHYNLKLRDLALAKSYFFKLIMTKSNFKNHLWRHFRDVIVIMSPKTSPN